MARQVRRHLRGTAAQNAAYTGPLGEPLITSDTRQSFIHDGETPGGIEQISVRTRLLASFVGAVPQLIATLLFSQCHAVIWGVEANAGTSQTAALRKAITHCEGKGSTLILPEGKITLGPFPGDDDAVLRITKSMNLRGAGRSTMLDPLPTVGSRDIIRIMPLTNGGGIQAPLIRDFSIGELGSRNGGIGIHFVTTNLNGFIRKPLVDNVGIGEGVAGSVSIQHTNNPDPATGNLNGGLFGGTIQNCDLFGCVKFIKTGDSNNFIRCVITGPGIGIDYEAISGAATHVFTGLNITAHGGALALRNLAQAKVFNCQLEGFHPYTGTENALVVVDGSSDCWIAECNANAYDRMDVILFKNGSSGNTVEDMSVIYSTSAGKYLVRAVGSPGNIIKKQRSDKNCTRTANGPGEEDDTLTFTNRVRPRISLDAASYPTVGVFQKLTLGSGWADGGDANFEQGLWVALMPDGTVRFRGTTGINSGTQDSVLATLPPAYRPAKAQRVGARMFVDATTWGTAMFVVDVVGSVSVQAVSNRGLLQWDDVSFSIL